jgi:hypothetical protein
LERGPITYEVEHRRAANLDAWLLAVIRDRAESPLVDVMPTSPAASGTGPGNGPILSA